MSTVPNIPFNNLNPPPVDGLGNLIITRKNDPPVQAVSFLPGTYLEQDPCQVQDSQFFCLSMWVYVPKSSFTNAGLGTLIPLFEFGPNAVEASQTKMWIKRFAEAFDATLLPNVIQVTDEPNEVDPNGVGGPAHEPTEWVWYKGWYWQFGTLFTEAKPGRRSGFYLLGAGSTAEIYAILKDINGNLVTLPVVHSVTDLGSNGGTKAFIPNEWNWITCSFKNDVRLPYAQSVWSFPARQENIVFGVEIEYAQIQFWNNLVLDFTDPEVRQFFVYTVASRLGMQSTQPETIYPAANLQRSTWSGFDKDGNPIFKPVYSWTSPAQVKYGTSQIYLDGTANEFDISIGTDEFVENRGTANSVKFIPKSVRLNPDNTPIDPQIIPFEISPSIPR